MYQASAIREHVAGNSWFFNKMDNDYYHSNYVAGTGCTDHNLSGKEGKVLYEKFGKKFERYKAKVPAYLPKLRKNGNE